MRLALPLALCLVGCSSQAAPPAGDLAPMPEVVVIDGDTLRIDGETIRLETIDTPEMPPRAECWAEARLAHEARRELEAAISGWVAPVITRSGRDRYGRTLARVSFDGGATEVGEHLVAKGVAVPWTGRQWDWCGAITDAEEGAGLLKSPEPLTGARLTLDALNTDDPRG